MEAEYGLTQSAFAADKGDETLAVKFFKRPIQNETKSEEEGRPIFEEIDHIEIAQPGNKDSVIIRKKRVGDEARFPEHWRRYVERTSDDDVLSGTPLKEWPQITASQVEEFRFYKVRTVEQLAAVTDVNLQNMMGGVALKQKAKAFLEQSVSNDELGRQLKEAQAQIAQLLEQSKPAPVELGEKPKRKRRTKAEIAAQKEFDDACAAEPAQLEA